MANSYVVRDLANNKIYEPTNEHWVWTSNDPNIPADFLPLANKYGSEKPHYEEDPIGGIHWFSPVYYNADGSIRYLSYDVSKPKNATSLTFDMVDHDETIHFVVTATRQSATDISPILIDNELIAAKSQIPSLKGKTYDVTKESEFKQMCIDIAEVLGANVIN